MIVQNDAQLATVEAANMLGASLQSLINFLGYTEARAVRRITAVETALKGPRVTGYEYQVASITKGLS